MAAPAHAAESKVAASAVRSRWALWACALTSACATVAPRPELPRVDVLRFEGVRGVDEADLRKKILTTQSGVFPDWVPFDDGPQFFDANAWQADLRRVIRYYQAHGYYQAQIVEDATTETVPGHVAISVRVSEGAQTHIGAVEVKWTSEVAPAQRADVEKAITFKVGDVFLESDWEAARPEMARRLREYGYAEAIVEGEARVLYEEAVAQLSLVISPGDRYRFGAIFVAADPDAKVPRQRIAEQVEPAATPGEFFQESALNEAQARVFAMGVFGAVKVNRGAPDRQNGTVPIIVDVREAPFRSVRAGGGVGIDSARNEGRLIGEFTDRNFFGGLRRFSTKAKLGYAFLPNIVAVVADPPASQHGVIFNFINEFEQPRFFLRDLSFRTAVDISSSRELAYNYVGGTLKAGFVWQPWTWLTVFPSYNLDLYFLSSAINLGGSAPEKLFDCPTTCVISYLEQTVAVDKRDDRLEPKEGFLLSLSVQEGGGPLGGSFSFVRLLPEARGYVSFGETKRVTLSAKVRLGTILTGAGSNSPIVSRFFSGGSDMRGFGSRRLSPMLPVPTLVSGATPMPGEVVPGEAVPVGGNGLFEASFEARWNVWGNLVLAAFSDTGFVTSRSFDFGRPSYFFSNLLVAVGLGVRYKTPLGPIRFDIAGRLPIGPSLEVLPEGGNPVSYPVGGCFFWGGGSTSLTRGSGYPENACNIHLSIGEAF